jgi:hypothetical protein
MSLGVGEAVEREILRLIEEQPRNAIDVAWALFQQGLILKSGCEVGGGTRRNHVSRWEVSQG